MKITILVTTIIFIASQVFGQSIKFVSVNDLNTDLSGTTIEVEGDKNDATIYSDFRVINVSSADIEVKYTRIREVNSGRLDQVCDNSLCYDAADAHAYTSPILNLIPSGDSSIFKPQIVPNGIESCAVHNYYVINDFGVAFDSIRVIFKTTNANCNLSVDKELKKTAFSVFPNPAQDFITVKGDELKNGGNVVFLDALGKEVKRAAVNSSNAKIAVNDLRRGVYFVNVYGINGSKSNVQRLIIQ